MKSFRKIVSILSLLAVLPFLIPGPAVQAANPPQHQDMAQVLNSLGLLLGTPQGFELEKTPDRAQGAVMLVRLLGQEANARSSNYTHPFGDVPSWADPYVGYMYRYKLSQGISPHQYNPQGPLSASQYTAFVLRALGYDDRQGDFNWNLSLEKAYNIGLLDKNTWQQLKNQPLFCRDDMVLISYLALQTKIKDRNQTLLQKLVDDKVIPQQIAEASGLYPKAIVENDTWPVPAATAATIAYKASNQSELTQILQDSISTLQTAVQIKLDYPDALDNFEDAVNKALNAIEKSTGLCNLLKGWQYRGTESAVTVKLTYRYSASQLNQLKSERDRIISGYIKASMSDYDKEKVLHDYIIEHSRYDYQNLVNNTLPPDSYTAYGVLLKGSGVCQGYAEAMNILARKAGLETIMISGSAYNNGSLESHAWNLIKINGGYYHLDVTWDDPVDEDGTDHLLYTYFNLNDKEMQKDHSWQGNLYPNCISDQFNYYIYNHKYAADFAAFTDYLHNTLQNKAPCLDMKIIKFNPEDYRNIKNMLFNSENVSSISYQIDETHGIINISQIEYF